MKTATATTPLYRRCAHRALRTGALLTGTLLLVGSACTFPEYSFCKKDTPESDGAGGCRMRTFHLVINEIDLDKSHNGTAQFLELFNNSPEVVDLTGTSLHFVEGSETPARSYDSIPLSGTLPGYGYLVVAHSGVHVDTNATIIPLSPEPNAIQHSNGITYGVALYHAPSGTIIDAIVYGGEQDTGIRDVRMTGEPGAWMLTDD